MNLLYNFFAFFLIFLKVERKNTLAEYPNNLITTTDSIESKFQSPWDLISDIIMRKDTLKEYPDNPITTTDSTESKIKTSFEYGNLANISVQDISTQIIGNDKIIKKIATFLPELASNYESYASLELSLNQFSFRPKFVKIVSPNKSMLFHSIIVSQNSNNNEKKFTTTIGCDLSGLTKIYVTLPTYIRTESNLIIKSLAKDDEVVNKGQFSYIINNGALLRQSTVFKNGSNLKADIKQQVFSSSSSINLEIDSYSHQLIYKKIDSFIDKLESSIGNYLLNQLNEKIINRNITLMTTCSKFIKAKTEKKISPSIDNESFLNTLYAISNPQSGKISAISLCIVQSIKSEADQMITISPGAIVIEGLNNFTNFEITLSNFNDPQDNRDHSKTLIMRMKSGILTGKFAWFYSLTENEYNHTLEFPFFIDHLKIEVELERKSNYNSNHYYNSYDYDRKRTGDLEVRVKVNLKKIIIDTSLPDIYCEQEEKFQRDVLSEYLETAIVDSLQNSVRNELNNNRSVYVDFFK